MRIIIFNHYAATPESSAGTRHYDLSRYMVEQGHDVTILASGFDHVSQATNRVSREEGCREQDVNGVHFVWFWTPAYRGNGLKRILNMLVYSWRALLFSLRREHPEVIVGSSVHPFAALVGWIAARYHQARFVFEVRDLWPQTLVDLGSVSVWHPFVQLLYLLEWFLFKQSHRIVTLLPAAHDYMIARGADPLKIHYVPNGVDLEAFDRNADATVEAVQYRDPSRFNLVYVGSHGLANCLETILQAAQFLQEQEIGNVLITFIGSGPDKKRLQEISSAWGLQNIQFLDPIPKHKVPAVLKTADACCVVLKESPLYRYGISLNKIFDYLASGRPIIFSGGSINNPVAEAEAGISVPAEDHLAFAQAVIQLANTPVRMRDMMGNAGRSYVERHHDIRILGEKYIRVLS